MRFIKFIILLISITIISKVLEFLGLPLAYLFGAIIGTLIFIKSVNNDFWFPKPLANSGVFIMGIQIGTSLTIPAMIQMAGDWVNIVIISLLTLSLALFLSIPFKHLTNSSAETAILASVPGALSQMVLMAEENKNANLLLVSLTQTSRIVFIVIFVPVITHFFPSDVKASENVVQNLTDVQSGYVLLIPVIGFILYRFLKRIKFPAAILLGPIIATVAFNIIVDQPFTLDFFFIAVAQMLFGIRIGIQIATLIRQLSRKDILAITLQNVGLIFGTLIIVSIYIMFTNHEFTSLFLSAAPGGLAQIIVLALESGGDIAMISSYHIFRIFFIILVVVPVVSYYLKRLSLRKVD